MAQQSQVRNWNDASGSHTELLRPDGSWVQWTNGAVVAQAGADPARAEAFSAGQYDAVAEQIRYGNELLASPYGQAITEQERKLGETTKMRNDQQYGLQKDQLGISRGTLDLNRENTRFDNQLARDQFGLSKTEYDRRFGLDERKFGLDERSQAAKEAELDRRFGLDYAQQGIDFFKTAADYGKTPRSWTDALQFERPEFMKPFVQGLANPAFGAKGANLPQMNSITDSVGAATGATGLNSNTYDPAKAIQSILKGSPPSSQTGLTGQDIATVRLLGEIYKNGAQKLGEGTLESMDPSELQYAQGVFDQISPGGGDRFLRDYQRSRIPGRSNPFAAV